MRQHSKPELPSDTQQRIQANVAELNRRYSNVRTESLLERCLGGLLGERVALVSSFGGQSMVLLHMVAAIDPTVPVLFIDTGKHFGETLRFRDSMVARLGLTDVRSIGPADAQTAQFDPRGMLFGEDPNACCHLRKVAPLAAALDGFDVWISGRKRFQGGPRASLQLFENEGRRIKVNPLAHWGTSDLALYKSTHAIPDHPLVAQGFLSIGCMPCTHRASSLVDERSGRWPGSDRSECGIHTPAQINPSRGA